MTLTQIRALSAATDPRLEFATDVERYYYIPEGLTGMAAIAIPIVSTATISTTGTGKTQISWNKTPGLIPGLAVIEAFVTANQASPVGIAVWKLTSVVRNGFVTPLKEDVITLIDTIGLLGVNEGPSAELSAGNFPRLFAVGNSNTIVWSATANITNL